jgi:hypothetical protein
MVGTRNKLVDELLKQHPEIRHSYNLYLKSIDIYERAKIAMGAVPTIRFITSSTQTVRVNNDTNWSSKVFTCK